ATASADTHTLSLHDALPIFDGREIVGLLIFLTAVATDFFDGWLARRRGEITTLGTLLDPIADKLLISAAFISLVELGLAPAWMRSEEHTSELQSRFDLVCRL